MGNTLFLDLEGTLIWDTEKYEIIWPQYKKICDFILQADIKNVIIWSWAIHDVAEKETLINTFTDLNQLFPGNVDVSVVTVKEMLGLLRKTIKVNMVYYSELYDFFTKESLLIHTIQSLVKPNTTAYLIDDTTKNMFSSFDDGTTLRMIDVTALSGFTKELSATRSRVNRD